MYPIDETHDPQRTSWVDSANHPHADFPIQNLPFCLFELDGAEPEIGVGIGDQILGLRRCAEAGWLADRFRSAISATSLNGVMALDVADRQKLRKAIGDLLDTNGSSDQAATATALVAQSAARLLVPCVIGDYTDFYASIYHATNVGSMFRPDNPLLPNYKHIPIGYHGRASSIIVSGTDVKRPVGQKAPASNTDGPTRSPSKLLDFELEVGVFVGTGNRLGQTVPMENAEEHLFGLCLVNDWSARDIQKWEYQPLGPFLAKSFATTIAPWIVTMEALAPFRCSAFQRAEEDPQPLDYLISPFNTTAGGIDLQLEVYLSTSQMRQNGHEPYKTSTVSFTNMYWTLAQLLTHHASNGCNLQPGDLMASGTVSGPERSQRGSMLELSWNGDHHHPLPTSDRSPIVLPTGEERLFLGDGDEVIFRGVCQSDSHRRIGFGECRGIVLPASEH